MPERRVNTVSVSKSEVYTPDAGNVPKGYAPKDMKPVVRSKVADKIGKKSR